MTPDEQEAESHRYSNLAFYVLPLSSGNIAILTPRRDIYRIVTTWEEAKCYGPHAEAQVKPQFTWKTETPKGRRTVPNDEVRDILERLGL